MRRTLILAYAFALSAPALLPAQTIRWNDRPTGSWTDEAPRVRVWFEGSRAVPYGAPMRVRFEVSDNAFVTVVRVDDDGRMTVLFPRSRNQRAAVRAGQVYFANNPRLGSEISFVATGSMGGYVFALASYAPLDFSRFEYRDFERIGGWSTFTQVNRPVARRPDVFIDRFAASVLWDKDTPYDYDVDYYFPVGHSSSIANAYAYCGSMFNHYGQYGEAGWAWDDWDLGPYSFRGMCRSWYAGVQCFTYLPLNAYSGCGMGPIVVANPTTPPVDQPVDTAAVPNEGVVRGGLFGPTPIPVIPAGSDPLPAERPGGRFDEVRLGAEAGRGSEWDNIMSIPARATRKMKEEDARRERVNENATPERATFDRPEVSLDKAEKTRTADGSTRVQPPPREPTKAKGNSEPRRETTSRSGFGSSTGRTSEPRASNPDRVTRPVETKSTGTTTSPNPPSVQGATTTEKKKPPQS